MKPALLFFLLSLAAALDAQPYPWNIPDSLLKNANQVTLEDNVTFTVWSKNKTTMEKTYKVLLLNESAIAENSIRLYYDEFTKVRQASVLISDLGGKPLGVYSLKDFQDWKTDWEMVASENRVKMLNIPQFRTPFILQVSIEKEYKGSMFFPVWQPVDEERQSLLEATFTLRNLSPDPIRYCPVNIGAPEIVNTPAATEYRWSVKNVPAVEVEPFSGGLTRYVPLVFTGPTAFEMDGYEGDLNTWQSYGAWVNLLNQGRNDLSEAQVAEIKRLVEGIPDKREQIRAVYDYVQKSMRYVSIQLGIGSWQPFPASTVHEKKYGDCKALSMYTRTLLEALDIPSYYTLVTATEDQKDVIREDFPSPFFNHVFLTVPLEGDTLWLECTSSIAPFGYLGTFTSDRHALLIDDKGGRLIRTRAYSMEENRQLTTGRIVFEENGSAAAALDRTYTGMEIERDRFAFLHQAQALDQKNWFYDHLGGKVRELTGYRLKPLSDEVVPQTGFTAEVQFSQMAQNASGRLFIPLSTLTAGLSADLPEEARSAPLEVDHPYTETDSLVLVFPAGYIPESIPAKIELDTPFGKYRREILPMEDGTLTLARRFDLYKGTYPVTDYAAFRNFIKTVKKGDKERVVLKKSPP